MGAAGGTVRKRKSKAGRIILGMSGGLLQLLANIAFYVLVVIFVIRAADIAYDFAYQVFGDVTVAEAPGKDIKVTILKGESTMNVASKLELNKLIVNKYSFYFKVKLMELGRDDGDNFSIMPGEFMLNNSMNYDEILSIITDYSKSLVQDEKTVEEQENAP